MNVFGAKRLNQSRLWPISSTSWGTGRPVVLVGRGPVEGCPKSSLSPSSLLFPIEVILFSVKVRSRTGRGLVEATVTCQALNLQRLVNQSTPSSTDQGLPTLSMVLKLGKNLQGIREGDEDIEVSPIKMAYQDNLAKKLQKGEDKKKKSITLKAIIKEEEDVEEEKPSEEDDDLALITRKA
ncbi:hypothetical protein CK203_083162 [Vitis vinifera]|uniref:Uncharacterized protein n=1 Tax=Vitis vinifera TaxID=29760 RepID=A0A438DWI0_VITVI|nr:hypothetical protein CK203_083162 [Vitis vinifera]